MLVDFSLPEQRSGRAIVLPSALASANVKFYVKVLRTLLFPNPLMYFVHVSYDTGPEFYAVPYPDSLHNLKVKVTDMDLEFLCWSFTFIMYYIVFPIMYLVHVWCDDRLLVQNFAQYNS